MSTDATPQRMTQDLRTLGIRPGGILLVHSSLSSLGYVPGGPETVILSLLESLGPEGTLLLPALSYEHVGAWQTVFDVRSTPSNVGAIPEYFRCRPGTLRSVCPTHSMCGVGPLAEAILGEHHLDETPCGAHSPFRKLRDLGGQLLFLGCGMRPNTSMHAVEEVAQAPYLFRDLITYRLIFADGHAEEHRVWHHHFDGWRQRYDRLEALLTPGSELRQGPVLAARAHLLDVPAMWTRALAEYARDPYAFVEAVVRPSA
jgi:aminoglycoside 3-N-acetyltransferase